MPSIHSIAHLETCSQLSELTSSAPQKYLRPNCDLLGDEAVCLSISRNGHIIAGTTGCPCSLSLSHRTLCYSLTEFFSQTVMYCVLINTLRP